MDAEHGRNDVLLSRDGVRWWSTTAITRGREDAARRALYLARSSASIRDSQGGRGEPIPTGGGAGAVRRRIALKRIKTARCRTCAGRGSRSLYRLVLPHVWNRTCFFELDPRRSCTANHRPSALRGTLRRPVLSATRARGDREHLRADAFIDRRGKSPKVEWRLRGAGVPEHLYRGR